MASLPRTRRPPLEPIIAISADPRTGPGPEAGLALALCLSLNDIGLRTATADAIAGAITNGAATGRWLGAGLSRALLEHRGVKWWTVVPGRWVEPLTNIARTSDQHAHAVHVAIQILLASAQSPDRSRLNEILTLLRHLTLTHQRPVQHEGALDFLRELSPRSQSGRTAKEILALN